MKISSRIRWVGHGGDEKCNKKKLFGNCEGKYN
jgi:hypothetical protein